MSEKLSLDSLRKALKDKTTDKADKERERFETVARRYERAVRQLIDQIHNYVKRVPEFVVVLEEEKETFTSPAFSGQKLEISDHRLRISLGGEFLVFDPTATALACALGQVEILASRPISYLVEQVLYLSHDPRDPRSFLWGYRSMENLGRSPLPFDEAALLKMLHTVFAA